MLKQRRDVLEQIANSPKADYKARIAAHHLAGEIAAVVMKLYTEGPAILASRHRYPRTSLTEAESTTTTGLAMKLSSSSSSSSSLPSHTIKEQEEEEFYGDENVE